MSKIQYNTKKKHKVWLLIDSLIYGGIESHVLELAKGLKDHSINVTVVFISHYNKTTILDQKLKIASIPYFFANKKFPALNHFVSLKIAIKSILPNLIHTHGYKANLYIRTIRYFFKYQYIKQISTYHAGERATGKIRLYDLCDRYTACLSSVCLAVSKSIQQKLPTTHSYVINNFISLKNITKSKGTEIAFVGRLSHEKAPDRFVNLAKQFPEKIFHCYGTGPMKQTVLLSKPNNLIIHGYQINMHNVWKNISVLIICSRYEGMPMVALEAMARGIPVFSLKVGDMAALIQSKYNGFLAKNIEELSHHLNNWFIMSDNAQLIIRQKAIETIYKFYSSKKTIPKILQIYQI
ncbi:glycosyltransferase family 4 protein [Candidatus Photodesmus anomalopis]|uniref:Glycosyl transferases group I n=1 Tax=Candidatus Photodesmus katoptron Akat1 TaxID=1236703 RepID=S3EGW7_9GAMM|nr:glycosyltransferase family 4 protein [Candidatus Photodesmus katoptron]EPE37408.1 glycosyl transferases group I [Candidatus Photodesmus katoptron Akat1]